MQLAAGPVSARDDQDVRRRTIFERVIGNQVWAAAQRPQLFRNRKHPERRRLAPLVSHGKDLERSAEVQQAHIIKQQNGDFACRIHGCVLSWGSKSSNRIVACCGGSTFSAVAARIG